MLKKIEIKGFKSFAERTQIEFEGGITCIVGPNGSGKSNITDAFRWVFGEQSYKSLRGTKMQDVIFNGTHKREPQGFAEVRVVFDNSAGELKLPYSEVEIIRKLFRSGISEYKINGNACRLKDIKDLFMDTGIGVEGYSIIGQGRIDQLLSSDKDDRRLIFEEASGIVKYKSKKEEAVRKLERTGSHLERIDDIIFELEQRLEPLRIQSEAARKYNELKDNLKSIEITLFCEEIERLQAELAVYNDSVAKLEAENERVVEEMFGYKENELKLAKEIDDLNFKKEAKKSEREALDKKKLEIDFSIKTAENRLRNAELQLEQFSEKREKITAEFEVLNSKIEELIFQLDLETAGKNELEHIQNSKKSDFDARSFEQRRLEEEIGMMKAGRRKYYSELEELNIERAGLLSRGDQLKKLIEEYKSDLSGVSDIHEVNIANLKTAHVALDEAEKRVLGLKEERGKIELELSELLREQQELENSIFEASTGFTSAENKRQLLQKNLENFETSSDAVKLVMKNADKSRIYGTVGSLISVEESYETAIEAILAARMDNIIVESFDDASKCIELIRRERVGRATFMPLDNIKANERISHHGIDGIMGHAMDFISFDENIEPAIRYLLFNVFIAEDLTGAKIAKNSLPLGAKIVTLDGDIVNVGGTVSGGNTKARQSGTLKLRRELDHLNSLCAELSIEAERLRTLRNTLLERAEDRRKSMLQKQEDLDNANSELLSCRLNLDAAQNRIAEGSKYELDKKTKLDEYERSEKDLLLNLSRIEDTETRLKTESEKDAVILDELSAKLNDMRVELDDEKERINNVDLDILDKTHKINIIKADLDNRRQTLDRQTSELKELDDSISYNKNLKKELDEQLRVSRTESEACEANLSEASGTLNELNISLDKLRDKSKSEIEKLREIEKKQLELKDEMYAIKINSTKLETRLEGEIDGLWRDYEMGVQAAKEVKIDIDVKDAKRKVKQYKAEISELGEVNLAAITEYAGVKDRYDFLSNQKNDLRESIDKLNAIITEMDDKMKEIFLESLNDINKKFESCFRELFGGGNASISLADPDDVLGSEVIINAEPPGKRLTGMELLSGGEKALTAISILFAILKTKPAPFCILDEIEAALDDRNLLLFSNYLKNYTDDTQFVVITHRKSTMEIADAIYGVTMKERGVSDTLSLKFETGDDNPLKLN